MIFNVYKSLSSKLIKIECKKKKKKKVCKRHILYIIN